MDDGKKIWEDIAQHEAYFGVATYDKYLAGGLDEKAKREFFESGREHIDLVFRELETACGSLKRPGKALDYGCGVGRVLLPLAEGCESVVGVDIAAGMLDECRRNLNAAANVSTFELRTPEEFMAGEDADFDLVHSYIVLQHVKPQTGYRIIEKILKSLKPGGVGMIHVTHTDNSPLVKRLRTNIYRDVPWIHDLLAKIRGETRPFIPMYSYDMARIRSIMRDHGCQKLRSLQTDHGYVGEMIFFNKTSSAALK